MHTGQTDNYELTQFASSDKPAWLTDYNGDMRKIDAGMKANADAIAQNAEDIVHEGEDITELKDRMLAAEQDIDGVQEKIGTGTLETQAQDLIGAANEILGLVGGESADIEALEQAVAGMGDSIRGVSQLAYTIANVYDSAQTYDVDDYAIYQNTLYKCVTAITVGEAFDPAKWTSVKVMNEINGSTPGPVPTVVTAEEVSYDNEDSGLEATNAQAAIDEVNQTMHDTEESFRQYLGELQTTMLTAGQTTATVTFENTTIGATTILTPVCSKYGVSPTAVTYTTNTMTFTYEAQTEDMVIGARVQNVV